jgi:hypothetical protein
MNKFLFIALLALTPAIAGIVDKPAIGKCYLSFDKPSNLKMAAPDHFPEENDHTRTLPTANGDVAITILDGYRVLYNNLKNAPFVNLKVELSNAQRYEADKQHILDNLKYMTANSPDMETKDLIQLSYNGYKIYGISRNGIETGSTLGVFIMFPGNNTVVYFYFNNLNPLYRNFNSLHDYQQQRNTFISEYTSHLNACKK